MHFYKHVITHIAIVQNVSGRMVKINRVGICICGYNNNNIYLLQLRCHPVAVVILHVNKT